MHPLSMIDDEDFTLATDPQLLFEKWFEDANQSEIADANAMTLATIDEKGLPNARIVLLKSYDIRGFVFYTNYESAKGRELLRNPQAALCFHWKSLTRQVRIRGNITQVSQSEADAYYNSRPRGSRIGAWASQQSRPLENRAQLEQIVDKLEKEFDGMTLVRPRYWSGFRLSPVEIEFWHDRPFRLHDRIVFRRSDEDAAWAKARLYP